jgi:starvation-inducible DNA-binding protein
LFRSRNGTEARVGTAARPAIEQANDLGDLDTADLFTEVGRGTGKWLWFMAHRTGGAA